MAGSFTFGSLPPAMSSPAVPVLVCFYTPADPDDPDSRGRFTPLPNIACMQIRESSGPHPPTAQFEYMLDDNMAFNYGWPSEIEQIWPIDAQESPYVVENDDRIIVIVSNSNNVTSILFDGFAQVPQADISESQAITFTALGVASRCWDSPIRGRMQRNADSPEEDVTGPIDTDLPCRFNPSDASVADGNKGGIQPNCIPADTDVDEGDDTVSYPVFLDSDLDAPEGDISTLTYWSVSKACRYLMSVGNDQTYVNNPDFTNLTSLLAAYSPPTGSDISTLSSDTTADVVLRDFDASDKAWPDAIHEPLSYAGFEFAFVTSADGNGFPQTNLHIYRNDALTTIAPKQLFLQPTGGNVGDAPNNVFAFHVARDCNAIVNQYSIESPLKHIEAAFLLAPLYRHAAGDDAPGPTGVGQFVRSSWTPDTTAVIRRKYRWYGMDEAGDGHWSSESGEWITEAFDFGTPQPNGGSVLFPNDGGDLPTYVRRYRPGLTTLISLDTEGHPLKAELAISFNSSFNGPAVWDGSDGDWYPVDGWKLLPDRLGIEVTEDDPEQWKAARGVQIRGVSWFTPDGTPPAKDPFAGVQTNLEAPVFRLTTVINDDRMLKAVARKRTASPTRFTRRRRVDCRDHFQLNVIDYSSPYNSTGQSINARDDTSKALAHATALRAKTEFPPVAGAVTLPFITDFYGLGDRISEIDGRNISLQKNVGASTGEAPDCPIVVSRTFRFQPHQETELQLADNRAEGVNL